MNSQTEQTCCYEHYKKLIFTSIGLTVQSVYIVYKLNHDYPENNYDDDDYDDSSDDELKWKWPIVFIPSYITFGGLMVYGVYWYIKKCKTHKNEEYLPLNDGLVKTITKIDETSEESTDKPTDKPTESSTESFIEYNTNGELETTDV